RFCNVFYTESDFGGGSLDMLSFFILMARKMRPIAINSIVVIIPSVGLKNRFHPFVIVIIPLVVINTVGTASSSVCRMTHGHTDFVNRYISTYIIDHALIMIKPKNT